MNAKTLNDIEKKVHNIGISILNKAVMFKDDYQNMNDIEDILKLISNIKNRLSTKPKGALDER